MTNEWLLMPNERLLMPNEQLFQLFCQAKVEFLAPGIVYHSSMLISLVPLILLAYSHLNSSNSGGL